MTNAATSWNPSAGGVVLAHDRFGSSSRIASGKEALDFHRISRLPGTTTNLAFLGNLLSTWEDTVLYRASKFTTHGLVRAIVNRIWFNWMVLHGSSDMNPGIPPDESVIRG